MGSMIELLSYEDGYAYDHQHSLLAYPAAQNVTAGTVVAFTNERGKRDAGLYVAGYMDYETRTVPVVPLHVALGFQWSQEVTLSGMSEAAKARRERGVA